MQDYIAPTEKRTVPEGAALVGIDSEGRVHYTMAAKAHDDRVFVATDDGVQVFDLSGTGRTLEDWIAHVDEWETLHHDESLVDMLADGLEAGA